MFKNSTKMLELRKKSNVHPTNMQIDLKADHHKIKESQCHLCETEFATIGEFITHESLQW